MNERAGPTNHRFWLLITNIQPLQKFQPHLAIPTLVQNLFLLPLNQFQEYSTVSDLNPLTHVMKETMEPNNHQFWLLLTNLESVTLFQAKQKIENLQVQTCSQCNSSLIFKILAVVAVPITSPVQWRRQPPLTILKKNIWPFHYCGYQTWLIVDGVEQPMWPPKAGFFFIIWLFGPGGGCLSADVRYCKFENSSFCSKQCSRFIEIL
jgi:hypothetical protein